MKTIIVGFDAFDPVVFEKLHAEGKTPNLSQYVEEGGYSRFGVTNPPQSEVSWTSIATGMNPGEHGIFDFVHRNPLTYGCQVSLLPTKKNVLGRQFVPPHRTPTIFDAAVGDGYPAVSLWWPATFPARLESSVWSIPGLGTPDIFGRLGVGVFYSLEQLPEDEKKTRTEKLTRLNSDHFKGELEGPTQMTLSGAKSSGIHFELDIVGNESARLLIAKQSIDLELGKWSPIIELNFKVGFGIAAKAVTRVLLTRISPDPFLYFLPLQLHPLRTPWPYATPKRFVKDIWKTPGPYLTLGWPQDTIGLEEGFISDEQFLNLCDQICDHRERTLMYLIDSFEEGVLACVFDSLDRVQHMFLRDRRDVVEGWYVKLDSLLGRIRNKLRMKPGGKDPHLLVMSDHGFGAFDYKVNMNRWLVNNAYLKPETQEESGDLSHVDWSQSNAYAVGLNSIYLNLAGREGQGIVTLEKKTELLQTLRDDLLRWKGPDGKQVVRRVLTQEEAFHGPLAEYGPDLVIGYQLKYRASAQTGLGQWGAEEIEINKDHWGADHCFDSESVPGVLFSSRGLRGLSHPSYADIPILAIDKAIDGRKDVAVPTFSDEDQKTVEERLKELGYL